MQRTPPVQSATKKAIASPPSPAPRSKRQRPGDSPAASSATTDKQEEIMSMLQKVLTEVTESRKTNTEIKQSLEFYIQKCEELTERVSLLEREKALYITRIQTLENRQEESDKFLRSTCLEIRGVPSQPKETKQDLCALVEKLHKIMKVDAQTYTIKDIYRIRGKQNEERPVIVDYTSTITKTCTLQAVKRFNAANTTNRLNTNTLGIDGKKNPIYVSEFLTPMAKRLFFLARDVAKSHKYDFCWTANGRIFLRKVEGSPAIIVRNEQQLADLKQKN